MGFWQGVTRVVRGEPVFQAEESGRPIADQSNEGESLTAATDQPAAPPAVTPEVTVGRCETNRSGDDIELWLTLRNDSSIEVEFDKIDILGRTTELDRFMKPGEEREFMVYRGDVLRDDDYGKASIYYKRLPDGDYFCADQRVDYHIESDGTYEVEELHLIRPVRDI